MARQRMINTKFWSDPWIVDDLNPLDRYLFLYLLTNEKANIVGVYELSLRTMANETGLDKEEITRMLQRLESRVVYVAGWVVFRKAIKHQNYRSDKIQAAVARELKDVPKNVIEYITMPSDLSKLLHERYGIDTVSIQYGSPIVLNLTKVTKPNLTKPNLTKPNADLEQAKPRTQKIPTEIISGILQYWQERVGLELGNEESQRKAIASLIRQRGEDGTKKLVDGVVLALEDQYAPRISDFVSLKRKQNDLIIWGRKRGIGSAVAEF